MAKDYDVTSAGVNPAEDRAHRMRMYFIAMALRVLCVLSLFWLHGWWIVLPALGAIFLPYFAVMIGNAVAHGGERSVDAPEPLRLEPAEAASDAESPADPADSIIVIDVEPARRAAPGPAPARDPHAAGRPADGAPAA